MSLTNNSFGQLNFFNSHPFAAALQFGKSFDIYNPSNIIGNDVFESFGIKRSNEESSKIFISILNSRESIMNTFRIDANLDAGFDIGIFSAGIEGSINTTENKIYNSSSLTICLSGIVDYGTDIIEKTVLSPAAKNLLTNPKGFKQSYGEYYVSGQKREQIVYLLITLSNISTEYKKQVMQSLGGSIDVPIVFSASLSGSMNSLIQQFKQSGSLSETAILFGKNKYSDVPDVVSDVMTEYDRSKDFSQASIKAISNYMQKNFRYENSSSTRYFYSPLSQFGYLSDTYFEKAHRKYDKYIQLRKLYASKKVDEVKLNSITTSKIYDLSSQADKKYIESSQKQIQTIVDNLADNITDCKSSSCDKLVDCCNLSSISDNLDRNKIDQLYNKYYYPFSELSFYSTPTSAIINNLSLTPVIINKTSSIIPSLDLSKASFHKFRIVGDIYLLHQLPGVQSYGVDVLANGFFIRSGPISGVANTPMRFHFESDEFSFNQTFNGQLLQNMTVGVRGFTSPFSSILLLPGSYVTFEIIQ